MYHHKTRIPWIVQCLIILGSALIIAGIVLWVSGCTARPVTVANARDANDHPIPVLVAVTGGFKATTVTTNTATGAVSTTDAQFNPVKIPAPPPDPNGTDWTGILFGLLGLIPGIGGTLSVVLPKLLTTRKALKEVVAGVQLIKEGEQTDIRQNMNRMLAAKQSPKTRAMIRKIKGK